MAIKRLYDTLIGATAGENQLMPISSTSKSATIQGVTFVDNRDGSYTFYTGENGASATATFSIISKIDGGSPQHVHYLKGNAEGSSISTWYLADQYNGVFYYDFKKENIVKVLRDTPARLDLRVVVASGTVISAPVTIKPQVIDLTAFFGSTIADYLYSLETATAGAGIAKLKEWGFFTEEYIPYNAGSLESVEARSHVMRGFNQWDEEWELGTINASNGANVSDSTRIRTKNYIRVLPDTNYFFCIKNYSGQVGTIAFYDADYNFVQAEYTPANTVLKTPKNVEFMKIGFYVNYGTTYNHDICINISNPDRNGEYEPYHEYSYDLGTDTLRGLFKLDSNNNLYADGDTKTSDGVIQRKYGVRAYQSGDESLADAITDGTNTVYKLATPTTEQSTPFQNPQICDPDGTEEYVTSNGVPVGHETRYQL